MGRPRARTAIALSALAGFGVVAPLRINELSEQPAAVHSGADPSADRFPGGALPISHALAAAPAWAQAADSSPVLPATVGGAPTGRPLPGGFVGISAEFNAIRAYTGTDASAINPTLVTLLRGLAPRSSPVLRIGGDSTDWTWWPQRKVARPSGIRYALSSGWLRTTRALAQQTGARMILGINLATARPALARAEALALVNGIGDRYIQALELGNEPDLFNVFSWYKTPAGRAGFPRGRSYSVPGYISDFNRWGAALPRLPLAGPALAGVSWMAKLPRILSSAHGLKLVTFHRYPLSACVKAPSAPTYPSIANLMSDSSSSGLSQQVAPYVAEAHAHHLPFRLDELNSASCMGAPGVSDTFASALWMVDALFNLASVNVDGVNVHTLPGAPYQPFSFSHRGGSWTASVRPVYYGMLMFARAFPAGAQPVPVSVAGGPVKIWADQGTDGHIRVVMINKDPSTPVTVQLRLPNPGASAGVQRLQAPSMTSTAGVTLGGQSFGSSTRTGTLAGPASHETVSPSQGTYSVALPAASAALLTR